MGKSLLIPLILVFLACPHSAHANRKIDPVSSVFDISPGRLHRGGVLSATPSDSGTPGLVRISIQYELYKRNLFPIPRDLLTGSYEQILPEAFLKEDGYLALEEQGAIETEGATVIHQGRVPYRNLTNAHLVQIIPNEGKSELLLLYHPSIPGLGWDEVRLILYTRVPVLGDYWIEGKLQSGPTPDP